MRHGKSVHMCFIACSDANDRAAAAKKERQQDNDENSNDGGLVYIHLRLISLSEEVKSTEKNVPSEKGEILQ